MLYNKLLSIISNERMDRSDADAKNECKGNVLIFLVMKQHKRMLSSRWVDESLDDT